MATTPELFNIDDITLVRTILEEFHRKKILAPAEYNHIINILDVSEASSTSIISDSDI